MDEKKGFFQRLKEGLGKSNSWFSALFSAERINDAFYEELEESLILADARMDSADKLVAALRRAVKERKIDTRAAAREELIRIAAAEMASDTPFLSESVPHVLLIVGVNGVGKTTSIGKIAHLYKQTGRKIIIAAADTFRAAAAEQLTEWAKRAEVPIIKHGEGGDPAAVVYDAIASYKARGADLLIIDTAGRLHNKDNLMRELQKIRRVIAKELPDTPCETLLVLDATTGQNAVLQAKAFKEVAQLTGLILTKLDGTAKGGVALQIRSTLSLPVRFVGVGEGINDLQPFDPAAFAQALF
ncbi:MAG: signal recognition particle-docking protein FtsY [Clostridiales bacterium]|nr:signal recognition particle-docking protein FtsY [Clostridiales bacterium]